MEHGAWIKDVVWYDVIVGYLSRVAVVSSQVAINQSTCSRAPTFHFSAT
jgi:hypothetical protein